MANLRDQFTATSTKVLKEVAGEEDSKISTGSYSDYLTIEDGLNKLRIFPKHPGETTFSILHACHWITFINDQNEEKRLTVPNSKIHGHTDKDIIEEYIAFVKRTLDSQNPSDDIKIKKLTKFPSGMDKQTTWLCYANKVEKSGNKFGLWDMKRTIRDALNDASIIEAEGESIEVDPFTDPDTGIPILITYNSKAKKFKDYYKVQLSKHAMPLTDEELATFAKIKPLSQLPQVNYTVTDFEMALEGIKFFDDDNEVGLFDSEEFQSIIEELRLQYDDTETDAKQSEIEEKIVSKKTPIIKKKTTTIKPIPSVIDDELIEEDKEEDEIVEDEIEEPETTDQFDKMDRLALRTYIAKNVEMKGVVLVYQKDTDDEIRDKIRQFIDNNENNDESPFKSETIIQQSSKKTIQSLDEIKAKLKNNKK